MPLDVWDDVLPDPWAYWAAAQAQPFQSVTAGAQTFHGIAPPPDPQLLDWLIAHTGDTPTLTFLRRSPAGQREPNWIHDDTSMGQWTALLYLTPHPAPGDGTVFYHARTDGAAWTDLEAWDPWAFVGARFNRLVRFPAAWPHARALYENYGTGADARLLQVTFGG